VAYYSPSTHSPSIDLPKWSRVQHVGTWRVTQATANLYHAVLLRKPEFPVDSPNNSFHCSPWNGFDRGSCRCSTTYLSNAPNLFCSIYIWDRVLHFCLGSVYASRVAGVSPCLAYLLRWGLANFWPGWLKTGVLLISLGLQTCVTMPCPPQNVSTSPKQFMCASSVLYS
jgi:hypothetical protein